MDSKKLLYQFNFFQMFSNKINLLEFFFIVFFFFISIFAYQIMPDATPLANSIELSISKEKPGFTADFLLFKKDSLVEKSVISSFFLDQKNLIVKKLLVVIILLGTLFIIILIIRQSLF